MTIYKASLNLISLLRKAKTIGGKYLKRWQVSNPKTGKMKWVYKYKPMSQRGAHEVTGKTFEKKTGGDRSEHKNAVEKALQSGNRVSLHVLRDYPDLVQKYGMSKRLERADRINAKVREIREKNKAAEKNTNETIPAALNSSKGEQNEMNTKENAQNRTYFLFDEGSKPNPMWEMKFDTERNQYYVENTDRGLGTAAEYYSHLVDNSDKPETKFSVANKYDLDKEQKAADEIYDWTGSEKQIAWAKKIRDTKLKQIKNFLLGAEAEYRPSRRGGIPGESHKDKILNLRKNFFDLVSFKDASFWINNRDNNPESFGRLIFLKDEENDISDYVFKDPYETQFKDNIKDIKNEFLKKSQE